MSKKILLILPALFLLTGAACSNQTPSVNKPATPAVPANTSNTPATPATPAQPQVNPPTISQKNFIVSATEYKMTPNVLNVTTNDQVRIVFKNDGTMPHNLTVQLPAGVATKTINPGETDAVAFVAPSTPQTISFWCTVDSHAALGMQGTIIVK